MNRTDLHFFSNANKKPVASHCLLKLKNIDFYFHFAVELKDVLIISKLSLVIIQNYQNTSKYLCAQLSPETVKVSAIDNRAWRISIQNTRMFALLDLFSYKESSK